MLDYALTMSIRTPFISMVSAALITIVVLAAFAIAYDDTTLNSGNFMKNTQRSISRAGYNINPLTKEQVEKLAKK